VVVREASRLTHGGSGDVKTEWFEDLFEKELGKYARFITEMTDNQLRQDKLLQEIKVRDGPKALLLLAGMPDRQCFRPTWTSLLKSERRIPV
jgi:hypothetical protein